MKAVERRRLLIHCQRTAIIATLFHLDLSFALLCTTNSPNQSQNQPVQSLFHRQSQPSARFCNNNSNVAFSIGATSLAHHNDQTTDRSLAKCSIVFTEPNTGCEVTLIGCFHGSPLSADDVRSLLKDKPPDVLVLELCPERYRSIQEHMRNDEKKKKRVRVGAGSEIKRRNIVYNNDDWAKQSVTRLFRLVSQTQSTLFTDLQYGVEFTTALECCPLSTDIVLSDQSVEETLYRLSRLPRIALQVWIDGSSLQENQALMIALFGRPNVKGDLNIFDFGTRSSRSIVELFASIVIPIAIVSLLTTLSLNSFGLIHPHPPIVSHQQSTHQFNSVTNFQLIVLQIVALATCYLGLILPVSRIVLRERDDILARGVQSACHIAYNHKRSTNDLCETTSPSCRVTAILGLLHVNGVAQRLLDKDQIML